MTIRPTTLAELNKDRTSVADAGEPIDAVKKAI